MGLTQFAAPATDPITRDDLKRHLRITTSDDDELLLTYLGAAVCDFQNRTRRQLVTATWDYTLNVFSNEMELPKAPVSAITWIHYLDANGVSQTVTPTIYELDTGVTPQIVRLAYNQVWPSHRSQTNAITIRFVAGYGAASAVPYGCKAAIQLLAAHLYENREPVNIGNIVNSIPLAYDSLVSQYRVPRLP